MFCPSKSRFVQAKEMSFDKSTQDLLNCAQLSFHVIEMVLVEITDILTIVVDSKTATSAFKKLLDCYTKVYNNFLFIGRSYAKFSKIVSKPIGYEEALATLKLLTERAESTMHSVEEHVVRIEKQRYEFLQAETGFRYLTIEQQNKIKASEDFYLNDFQAKEKIITDNLEKFRNYSLNFRTRNPIGYTEAFLGMYKHYRRALIGRLLSNWPIEPVTDEKNAHIRDKIEMINFYHNGKYDPLFWPIDF